MAKGATQSRKTEDLELEKMPEMVVEVTTITLPTRSALWRDCNTGGGMCGFIDAGTYVYTEVKNGFTKISNGWVHCVPDEM